MARTQLFHTILCPVDFSEHSRQALAYGALLASRHGGRLVVVFVEDPMMAAAAAVAYDERALIDKSRTELRRLVERTIARYKLARGSVTMDVAVGRPHREIAWTAEHLKCDLIVMGAHGLTGASRLMIGSTTHRILRQSPLPVLAIPPVSGRARAPSSKWPDKVAIAPVDLGSRARSDALAAAVAAHHLGAVLQLVHVVEPIPDLPWLELDSARRNQQRQRRAMARLTRLTDDLDWAISSGAVRVGKPADEIAAVAETDAVGLIIMTRRRGQGLFGPRQGSISYRVLCQAKKPVLALPSTPQWLRRAIALRPKPPTARRSS